MFCSKFNVKYSNSLLKNIIKRDSYNYLKKKFSNNELLKIINVEYVKYYKKKIYNSFFYSYKKIKLNEKNKILIFFIKYKCNNIFFQYVKEFKYVNYELINLFFDINKDNKSNNWIKIIMNIFLYLNVNKKKYNIFLKKVLRNKVWLLFDYLSLSYSKLTDLNYLYKTISFERIKKVNSLGYEYSINNFIYIIKNKEINITFLKDNYIYFEYFNSNSFLKILPKLFKYNNKNTINYILDKIKYPVNKNIFQNCLNYALKYGNNELIIYILDKYKFKINNNLIFIFFKNEFKFIVNKKNIKYQINKRFIYSKNNYTNIFTRYNKKYEKSLIEIIKLIIKNKQKYIIEYILNKYLLLFFFMRFDNLISFLFANFNFNLNLSKRNTKNFLNKCIKNDNLIDIKRMVHYNVINIYDLFKNRILDLAIINNSKKVISFLNIDLGIVCSKNILNIFKLILENDLYYNYKKNFDRNECKNGINFLKNLDYINYPLDSNFLFVSINHDDIKCVNFLIKKKIKLTNKCLEILLFKNNKKIIKKINFKNYNIKINKLIDRSLLFFYKKCINNINFSHYLNNNLIYSNIKNLCNIYKGTLSKSYIKYSLYGLNLKLFKFLKSKFKIKLNDNEYILFLKNLLDYIKNKNYMIKKDEHIIHNFFSYIIDDLKIDISILKNNIIFVSYKLSYKFLDYLNKKLNLNFSLLDIFNSIMYNNFESFKFYLDYGLVPSKKLFIFSLQNNRVKIFNEIFNNLKIDLIENDIINILSNYRGGDIEAFKFINKKYNCFNYDHIKYMINNINKFTKYMFIILFRFLINVVKIIEKDDYEFVESLNLKIKINKNFIIN